MHSHVGIAGMQPHKPLCSLPCCARIDIQSRRRYNDHDSNHQQNALLECLGHIALDGARRDSQALCHLCIAQTIELG